MFSDKSAAPTLGQSEGRFGGVIVVFVVIVVVV